jgi:tripartite-type tricarboxylate transporter receptor subunit TctC
MAQQFPQRPVRVIVPFAAGGLVDTLARTIGSQFQATTGQPMIVDTRPGGSSIIGMTACAKAPPDGYTLCFTVADSLSYNAALFSDLPYAPDSDFTPILNLAWSNTNLIVANAKVPYSSFRELIAYAKANPGKVNWATWGPASLPDVYLRWINRVASTDMTAIPYKGAGAGNPAVLSGESDVTYMGFGLAGPLMKSGKLKFLISLGDRRSSYVPELPSLAEEGVDPGLKTYFAAFAPARTPVPVANRLNEIHRQHAGAIRLVRKAGSGECAASVPRHRHQAEQLAKPVTAMPRPTAMTIRVLCVWSTTTLSMITWANSRVVRPIN